MQAGGTIGVILEAGCAVLVALRAGVDIGFVMMRVIVDNGDPISIVSPRGTQLFSGHSRRTRNVNRTAPLAVGLIGRESGLPRRASFQHSESGRECTERNSRSPLV